jgi:hypothetical protein
MLLAFKVGEIDGLQMGSGIVYVGSPFCPDGLHHSTSCCSFLFGGAKMGSEAIFVDSPFCPDGLQRLMDFKWGAVSSMLARHFVQMDFIQRRVALFFLEGQKWGARSSLLTRLFAQMDFSVVLSFFLKSASF